MPDVVLSSQPTISQCEAALPLSSGSTLFCDFDGPIVDVSDRYYNTYRLALSATQQAYGRVGHPLPIRPLTKMQFWQMKQNRLPDTLIADWSGLSNHAVDFFLAQVGELVNQSCLLHQDALQPGARAALTKLQECGVRLVLVTLRQASQVLDFLHQYDLATAVSQIYGANDTDAAYSNRTEHKAAQLQEAVIDQNRLGFTTTQSWMVGDTEADVCAGQTLGLPTIALTCGIRSSSYLKGFAPTCIKRDLYAALDCLLSSSQTTPYHSSLQLASRK
jgi:phosphoglycolate phosphatase